MSKVELGQVIDKYLDYEFSLRFTAQRAVDLGYLMVPRSGYASSQIVTEVGENDKLAGELGLPPASGLILATTEIPEAALAAVFGGDKHDPLAPTEEDKYGWNRYSYNDGNGKSAPWAQALEEGGETMFPGQILFVPRAGFREHGDQPGHYFMGAKAVKLESAGFIAINDSEIIELASAGLVRWQNAPQRAQR